ncbi:MAG: methyltransferase [Oscillospiraceae bacterium]|nr:methyltransferase [Oscillospiraceae bacterium]
MDLNIGDGMDKKRADFKKALGHVGGGGVPVDFGATAVSGMHVSCVAALRDYYSLEKRPVKVIEPFQMQGEIDDDLKDALGVTVEGVFGRGTNFGFRNEGWKPWDFNGLDVLVPGMFNVTVDGASGDFLIYPEGDMSVGPSGRMPKGGFYFDAIIRQGPIGEDDELDPEDNLEEFRPLGAEDVAFYKAGAEKAARAGRGAIMALPGSGLGDIALVPGMGMKHPKGIRDVEEWYISTVARQDLLHEIFDRQTDIAVENIKLLHAAVGDLVDAVFLCGTDFGTQIGTFCSPGTFDSLYVPHYKKMTSWIHANTGWKVLKHSCGAVGPLLDGFIEAGFDILNPVQCSAAGMSPRELKDKYGSKLVFWGGGVDTQKTLPFGTPEEVAAQVRERCEIFAPGGGFVFNAIHNVQARTPVKNIVAMIDAVKAYNGS